MNQKAIGICRTRNLFFELSFCLEKTGDLKGALQVIIEDMNDAQLVMKPV